MATEIPAQERPFETIRWSLDEGIGMLMMDQPPSNAMTLQFFDEFRHWADLIRTIDGLKAIVIHGNGRHFSSGANLTELLGNLDERLMSDNYRSFASLEQLEVPVISAIRGVCLGSAFELALFCHFRISADDAVLGLPESTYNLMPGIGGIKRMSSLAGKSRAIELILRGTTFPAGDALKMRLVDAVVPKRDVLNASIEFARALPGNVNNASRAACIQKFLNKPDVTA